MLYMHRFNEVLIIQNSGLHEITLSIIAINFSDDYVIIPYLYRFSEASVGFSSLGLAPIRLRSLGSVLTTRSALFRAIFSESWSVLSKVAVNLKTADSFLGDSFWFDVEIESSEVSLRFLADKWTFKAPAGDCELGGKPLL